MKLISTALTLKRGVVNSRMLWEWISAVRRNGYGEKKTVIITLCNEAGTPVQKWTLTQSAPMK